MPVVEIPGIGNVEFPDSMSSEQMTAAAQQIIGQRRQAGIARLQQQNPREYASQSPEFQQAFGPHGTTGQNVAAGAGKFLFDLGRGSKQVGAEVADWFDPQQNLSDLVVGERGGRAGRAERENADARALDAPLMATKAGKFGNIAGGVAFTLPAMLVPGANTAVGAATLGAGLGGLQPTVAGESRLRNTLMGGGGGLAGYGAGKVLSGLLGGGAQEMIDAGLWSPNAKTAAAQSSGFIPTGASGAQVVNGFGHVGPDVSAALTRAQQQAMENAQQLGYKLTPGQATGSRALQQMEAKLESQPMTSGPFNTIKQGNQQLLNTSAAKAIGENASVVDSTVLADANKRIGQAFEKVADKNPRTISPDEFLSKVSGIESEYEGLLPAGGISDHPLVQRLTKFAENGNATGEQLQSLTSKLGKAANKAMTSPSGDRDLGFALYDVKNYVDDLLQQGLSDADAAAFKAARSQYRNLMLLTSSPNVVNPSTGNVNARALASLLQRKDKGGFLYGANDSDLYTGARFAQAFPPVVGDSGTATRSMVTNPLQAVAQLPAWAASKAYVSAPSVSAAQGAATLGRGSGAGVNALLPYLPGRAAALGALLAPQIQQQQPTQP